jgi:DNA-binding LytR/AlgR family response regulator
MKINIFFDKLMSKEELIIKSNPENCYLVQEIKNNLENNFKITVINASNNRKLQINILSILVFQSEGHMCCVKVKSGEFYLINKRLKEVLELTKRDFVKINNQTIINLNEVKEFNSASNARLQVMLSDESSYFVNRHYVKLIKERLSW